MLILDTLQNFVAGLFTGSDKTAADRYLFVQMGRGQLEAAYRGDWIARKVVDVPAFDMTREWRDWQAEEDQIEVIEGLESALGVQQKVFRALIRARLYGGGALVMGVSQGRANEELILDRVGKGDLKWLHVVSRNEISVTDIDRDVTSAFYGQPAMYTVNSTRMGSVPVHPSRIIRFVGNEIPDLAQATHGWGDSVLQAVNDAVRSAGLAAQGVAALIHEAKVDVIKVPNLMTSLASRDYADRLTARFMLANQMKSINNTLLLDKDEEWDRKQTNFAQLPELIRAYLQIASGAADIPATRLIGQAPQGMNATGESDVRNYYDRIAAEQNVTLRPALTRLDEVLIRSATGDRDEAIHYRWSPLWQMSEKEAAEVAKMNAERDQILINTGALPSAVLEKGLRNRLIESGEIPGIEAAYDEFDEGLLREDDEDTDVLEAEEEDRPPRLVAANDAAPRTLYVHRKVLNASAIIAHFKGQGFDTTLPADDLHVTIAFSRRPVDWMEMGENWSGDDKGRVTINAGGPRMMERFGEATVLLFASSMLSWRHEEMKRKGTSWDHPEYQPHITISYAAGDVDLDDVEAYSGEIVLGPEVFQEVQEDWQTGIREE